MQACRDFTQSVVQFVREKNAALAGRDMGWFLNMCQGHEKPEDVFGENLARLRDRIAAACARAGRAPDSVALVAVSKTKPAEAVEAALAAGQAVFGENRVQEAAAKFPALRARRPELRLRQLP